MEDSVNRHSVECSGTLPDAADECALLPCPFCGGAAEARFTFGAEFVECNDCHVEVVGDTFAEAFELWNRRAAPPAIGSPSVAQFQAVHDVLHECRAMLSENDGAHVEVAKAMAIVRAAIANAPHRADRRQLT